MKLNETNQKANIRGRILGRGQIVLRRIFVCLLFVCTADIKRDPLTVPVHGR